MNSYNFQYLNMIICTLSHPCGFSGNIYLLSSYTMGLWLHVQEGACMYVDTCVYAYM